MRSGSHHVHTSGRSVLSTHSLSSDMIHVYILTDDQILKSKCQPVLQRGSKLIYYGREMMGPGVHSWRQCEPGGQALWHENWHQAEARSSREAMSQRDEHAAELRKEARGQPDGSSTGP